MIALFWLANSSCMTDDTMQQCRFCGQIAMRRDRTRWRVEELVGIKKLLTYQITSNFLSHVTLRIHIIISPLSYLIFNLALKVFCNLEFSNYCYCTCDGLKVIPPPIVRIGVEWRKRGGGLFSDIGCT